MPDPIRDRSIRVGFYGTGRFANAMHIPILQRLDGVNIVALCDSDEKAQDSTAERVGLDARHVYGNGLEMLASEDLDVLFSCVPAYTRSNVETTAARRGVHLFSEKPQAVDFSVASRIGEAIRQGGVFSTVGFRERYRPMLQNIRMFLADKQVIHARCTITRTSGSQRWLRHEDASGGHPLEWGIHAVDYTRFMTGLNIVCAQAFYNRPEGYEESLSASFNFRFSNSATMTLNFVTYLVESEVKEGRRCMPLFTIYYIGGRLDVYRDGSNTWAYEVNGVPVVEKETFDPWFAHDKTFIEAVRSGDDSEMKNDYHDGLFTLAPLLAGWESSREDGRVIDVEAFMEANESL